MKIFHVVALLFVLAGLAFSANTVSGCMDIATPGVYQLNQNIVGASIPYTYGVSCIQISSSDVVLDCQGFNLTNDGTSDAAGIYIDEYDAGTSNITVENCNVAYYDTGISDASASHTSEIFLINNSANDNGDGFFIASDSNGNLTGNSAYNNSYDGLYLRSPYNDIVTGNNLTDNGNYDFFQDVWANFDCHNIIQNNTGSGNEPILWANSNIAVSNAVFSEVFLCNADGTKMTDVTVHGSDSKPNDGFYMGWTNDAIIRNVDSSDNNAGFSLYYSSGNTFINDTANSDTGSGFSLSSSSNNNLDFNTADNDTSEMGFYLSDGSNNILASNTANDNIGGIRLEQSNGNTIVNNTLLDNTLDFWVDIQSGADCINAVQNNTGFRISADNMGQQNSHGVGCQPLRGASLQCHPGEFHE